MLVNSHIIAMYIRLSKDDDIDESNCIEKSNYIEKNNVIVKSNYIENSNSLEKNNCKKRQSNSIKNQRLLIQNYIAQHPELHNYIAMEYCDDGYSGTNFDRPGVINLLKDVKEKRIYCIVVKDFSRFARNYLEIGNYLDQIFPFIGVRFISINDYFDSKQNNGCTVGIEVAAKNIIYDYYSKDLSQKVKSALKAKKEKGKYLGGCVPYGYKRSQIEKGRLIIDEEAADTVRKIFQMTKEGYSRSELARVLNEEGIPTPADHIMKYNGRQTIWQPTGEKFYWTMEAIIRILRNEVYLGKTISGKYRVKDVGSKQTMLLPKQEWHIIENTHEPIISSELFELTKKNFHTRKVSIQINEKSIILKGKVKCGYCKYPMDWIKGRNSYYKCISPRFILNAQCSNDHAVEREIEDIIISSIHLMEKMFLNNSDMYVKRMQKNYLTETFLNEKIKKMRYALKLEKLQEAKVYEKYKRGLLTKNEYTLKKGIILVNKKDILMKINQLECKIQYQMLQYSNVVQNDNEDDNKDSNKNDNKDSNKDGNEYDTDQKNAPISVFIKNLMSSMIKTIFFYDANHIEIVYKFKDEYH